MPSSPPGYATASKFQSTVVYLLYNLLNSLAKQSEVKQSEKENVAPAILFVITLYLC